VRGLLSIVITIFIITGCTHAETQLRVQEEIIKEKSLDDIWDELFNYWRDVERKHSIRIEQAFRGFSLEGVGIELRRFGDFERALTRDELDEIKKTFYVYAGTEFSLDLFQLYCCEQEAQFVGEITYIDTENNKIYIINHEIPDNRPNRDWRETPKKNWIQLSKDGKIVKDEDQELVQFNDLEIGQQVRAWSVHFINIEPIKEVVKIEVLSK